MLIDLNADMGEGFGAYSMGHDEELLRIVTSANIACGLHAGDASIMHGLAMRAKELGVGLGAHPGFNDLWGFGRRNIAMNASDLEYLVAYQIGAMQVFGAYPGAPLRHVKAHGALYNMAAKDEDYAGAIARAVKAADAGLIVVGLPGSEMQKAAEAQGLRFAREGFCDRLYRQDGSLMPRSVPGSLIGDPAIAAAQALRLARGEEIATGDGGWLKMEVDTLCVHGGEPGTVSVAQAVREVLEANGIALAPMLQGASAS
jgi:5-oxoprolinase (ATP-hydrolysing) subunit A